MQGLGTKGLGTKGLGTRKTVEFWLRVYVGTKKGGTNGLAVRAGRPVTQITSGVEG